MSTHIVQSRSLVIIVKAPFVPKVETAVQLDVVSIDRVAVRWRIVLQKPRIISLMQIDSVEARADAVPPAGVRLVARPAERSRSNQHQSHPLLPGGPLDQKKASGQRNPNRHRAALRQINP